MSEHGLPDEFLMMDNFQKLIGLIQERSEFNHSAKAVKDILRTLGCLWEGKYYDMLETQKAIYFCRRNPYSPVMKAKKKKKKTTSKK